MDSFRGIAPEKGSSVREGNRKKGGCSGCQIIRLSALVYGIE